MFIQHLAAEAQNMAKLDRKPRKNVQYKDLGSCPRVSVTATPLLLPLV